MTDHLHLQLPVTAPFRLDYTVAVVQRGPQNALDRWDGRCYRRLLIFRNKPYEICITQQQGSRAPILDVEIFAPRIDPAMRDDCISVVSRSLGLQLELAPFYQLAGCHPRLLALVRSFIGMRPSRFATLHEALVSAVACQQISLPVGIRFLNRLTESYGLAASRQPAAPRAFPTLEALAQLQPTDLRALGCSTRKGHTIIEVSRLLLEGQWHQEDSETMDDAAIHQRLCELPGIGPWTADYVLLRGLGRLGTFPVKDSGALNGIKAWLNLKKTPDEKHLHRILAPWRPYAGLIYFHLLLHKRFPQAESN